MKTKSTPILPLLLFCLCGNGVVAYAAEAATTSSNPPTHDAHGRVIPPEMAALKPEPLALASDSDHEGRGGWFIPRNSPLKRFYAGASVGPIWTDYSDTVDDGSVFGVDHGDLGTATSVFLGYNLNDYLGVETSYTFVDNVDFAATSTGTGNSWSAGPVGAEFEADVFAFILVGRYPVAPRWTIIGKIGFLRWHTLETYFDNGVISTDKDDGSSVMVVGGAEYDIGLEKRIKLRGEIGYQRFSAEHLDMVTGTVGFVYEFP